MGPWDRLHIDGAVSFKIGFELGGSDDLRGVDRMSFDSTGDGGGRDGAGVGAYRGGRAEHSWSVESIHEGAASPIERPEMARKRLVSLMRNLPSTWGMNSSKIKSQTS